MTPDVVLFSSLPGRYRILVFRCEDFACTCTEVTFKLKELREPKRRKERPRQISIRVDVPSWQESGAPHRSPEEAAVVAEFLRDHPQAERERLADWFRERDRIRQRLNECRVDPAEVDQGLLFSFREILAPPDQPEWNCPLGEHRFEDADAQYLVTEHFCIKPACACQQVHLAFLPIRSDPELPGQYVAEVAFRALMSLDGRAQLDRVYELDEATARRVLADWEEDLDAVQLKQLTWRYEKMREIGRRSMSGYTRRQPAELQFPPVDSAPTNPAPRRVGRNDPCPCGSGKKYKRCCARTSESALS